ncbi:MAG: VWA domain-containing protein [Phycisphaerae bacterium]
MSQSCPNCQSQQPDGARFCGDCGATLAATMVEGKTVLAPAGPPPVAANPQGHPVQPQPQPPHPQPTFRPGAGSAPGSATHLMNQREHTVFVIDKSGSMDERYDSRLSKVEAAARANATMVLEKARIDPNDRIGIVAFEDFAMPLLPLSPVGTHKRDIIQALQTISAGGCTDINEGLKAARDLFDWNRSDVVRRIVLLTDGHGGHPIRTAEELKSRGVVIDVIGVGDSPSNVDEKLLRKVSSVVQGELRYRFIKDQQTLVNHYTRLASKTSLGA